MGRQDLVTELYYSGGWNPAPMYVRDPVSITRGRGDESGGPTPSQMAGTLDNRSGDYNPRNAMSPLYGLVGRNTPIRSGLDLAVESFGGTSSSGWTPTDGGQPWTHLGAALADFTEGGGLGKHLQPLKNVVRISHLGEDRRDVEQVTTASIPAVALGASAVVGHVARLTGPGDFYWLRMEFDVGGVLTAKISKYVGGSLTELAALSGIPGLTYTGGQGWAMRSSVSGSRLAVQIWQPGTDSTSWTLTKVDRAITGAGRYGLASWVVAGNTNTSEIRFDDYRAVDRRLVSEVSSWKPDRSLGFAPGGQGDAWTKIEAGGILRRLGQGADPLASPLRRAIPGLDPSAYWPLEDADGALAAQSAVPGVADMQPFGFSRFTAPGTGAPVPAAGLPNFGTGAGIPGSSPVPDFTQGGVLVGRPTIPTSGTESWRVAFVAVFPRDKQASGTTFIGWSVTAGTYTDWEIQAGPSGLLLTASEPVGFTAGYGTSGSGSSLFDGLPHFIEVEAKTVAGNLDVHLYIDGFDFGGIHTINAPNLAYPPGWVRSITPNVKEWTAADAAVAGMPQIGHIAMWQPSVPVSGHVEAMAGHAGETAATRFLRLCAEEGIPAQVVGDIAATAPMGAQRTGVELVEHLAEIERTEGGLIFEPRDTLGLVLRTVSDLYNQAPALTLDWAAGQVAAPFTPVVDDLGVRNDVTAKSTTTGVEARAVVESGPMSVQPPPAGVGRYKTQLDVNPAADWQLPDLAWWAAGRGTGGEIRVAQVTVDLLAWPLLAAAASSVDVGDRIRVINLPADMGSNQVDLIVLGSTEVTGSHPRTITFNCAAARLYDVATVDGDARIAADGSTLAAALTSGGMSLLLASTAENGAWTTDPANMPLPVRVGGERVTASAIAPSFLDAFGRTVSSDWGNGWVTSGGAASDYSTNGFSGAHSLGTVGVLRTSLIDIGVRHATLISDVVIPVVPTGAPVTHWVVLRAEDLNNHYIARLDIATSGAATLVPFKRVAGTLSGLGAAVPVGSHSGGATWRVMADVHNTPNGQAALLAKAWKPATDAEPGWQVTAADAGALVTGVGTKVGVMSRLETGNTSALPVVIRWDNITVVNPQTVTLSARGVNGVQRAWPAGTEVDVWQPAILAL